MSDLVKRGYSAEVGRLHADTELGLKRVRDTLDSLDAGQIAYTPGDPSKWTTQPTTVAEALDLIAATLNPVTA